MRVSMKNPKSFPHILAALILWAAVAWADLALAEVPGDAGESLCGVWGCWPPFQALAALHGMWIVALAPPLIWLCRRLSPHAVIGLGRFFLALALLGFGAVALHEAATWLPSVLETDRRYFGWRIVYALGTHTELPVVQAALAGICCVAMGHRRLARRALPGVAVVEQVPPSGGP
jgi:hypothetical protein